MAALHHQAFTLPRPWSSAEFAALLDSPLVFALTAPGGFLLGRVVAGEAELLTVAVAPEDRGQGRGAELVAGFLAEARLRQAESAFLEVAADNAVAQRLYARQGFQPAGRRRGYYTAPGHLPQDALIMVCPLT